MRLVRLGGTTFPFQHRTSAWVGAINCTWSDGSLHDSLSVNVNIAETVLVQAEGPAKDGTLSCAAVGPRIDDASQAVVVDALDISTAVFEVVAGDNRSHSTVLGRR